MKPGVLGTLLLAASGVDADPYADAVQLYEAGDREAAARAFAALDEKLPGVAYHLGRLAFDEQRWDDALEYFEHAAEADPDNDRYWMWIGNTAGSWASRANVLRAGRLAGRVRSAFERAVELNPGNLDARSSLIGFHLQAPGIVGGDRDEAQRQLAAIRELDPRRGYREAARIQLMEEQPELAAAIYRQGLTEYPDDVPLTIALAVLLQQQEQYAEAHQLLLPLGQAESPDLTALYQLGRTGALSGQFLDDAAAAMARYIELAEQRTDAPVPLYAAWWRQGMIHEHADRLQDALKSYERAVALNPDDEQSAAALKALRRRLD